MEKDYNLINISISPTNKLVGFLEVECINEQKRGR